MNEKWTQDIRQKLSRTEQPAPQLDWDAIFRSVDEQRQARRHRSVVLWRRVAVAAALVGVLAGGAVYWVNNNGDDAGKVATLTTDHQGKTAERQRTDETPDDNTYIKGTRARGNTAEQIFIAAQKDFITSEKQAVATDNSSASTFDKLVAAVGNVLSNPFSATDTNSEPMLLAQTQEVEVPAECSLQPESAPTVVKQGMPMTVKKDMPSVHRPRALKQAKALPANTANGLTAKAYVSGALGSSSSASAMGVLVGSGSGVMNDAVADGEIDNITWNTASAMDRTVKHHQPVRLGLSVRYALTDRWSIEAGLSYSRHSSDITETSGDYARHTGQRLTFIGIPVAANYSIWSNRYVNVYASAGGEVERMVKGKSTVSTTYGGVPDTEGEETIKQSRPYFSVNASLGVEAKLGQTVSLYLEPGLDYHFKNGAELETIYSEKPLNGNLNLGVRFTLK